MRHENSLGEGYFDDIFAGDDDPWQLASSAYETAKFDATIAAIADRHYPRAIEIGCAQGVLTERLAASCDDLLAIDISARALDRARARVGERSGIRFRHLAFPREALSGPFDLVVLSEVAYYWDKADLDRTGAWLRSALAADGRVILVHFTGDTDYPMSGDDAVSALRQSLADAAMVERAERADRYRLDLWRRS